LAEEEEREKVVERLKALSSETAKILARLLGLEEKKSAGE